MPDSENTSTDQALDDSDWTLAHFTGHSDYRPDGYGFAMALLSVIECGHDVDPGLLAAFDTHITRAAQTIHGFDVTFTDGKTYAVNVTDVTA